VPQCTPTQHNNKGKNTYKKRSSFQTKPEWYKARAAKDQDKGLENTAIIKISVEDLGKENGENIE
jgi:hypothetical protein